MSRKKDWQTNLKWVDVFLARFPKPYEFNPDLWEHVFNEDLGKMDSRSGWSDGEICTVLKWMQSPGQAWKNVAVATTLVIAVRCYRKSLQSAPPIGDSAPTLDCAMCLGTGILSYWRGWRKDWTADNYLIGCDKEVVPCLCAKGTSRLNGGCYRDLREEDRKDYKRKSGEAAEQHRERMMAVRKWCDENGVAWDRKPGDTATGYERSLTGKIGYFPPVDTTNKPRSVAPPAIRPDDSLIDTTRELDGKDPADALIAKGNWWEDAV